MFHQHRIGVVVGVLAVLAGTLQCGGFGDLDPPEADTIALVPSRVTLNINERPQGDGGALGEAPALEASVTVLGERERRPAEGARVSIAFAEPSKDCNGGTVRGSSSLADFPADLELVGTTECKLSSQLSLVCTLPISGSATFKLRARPRDSTVGGSTVRLCASTDNDDKKRTSATVVEFSRSIPDGVTLDIALPDPSSFRNADGPFAVCAPGQGRACDTLVRSAPLVPRLTPADKIIAQLGQTLSAIVNLSVTDGPSSSVWLASEPRCARPDGRVAQILPSSFFPGSATGTTIYLCTDARHAKYALNAQLFQLGGSAIAPYNREGEIKAYPASISVTKGAETLQVGQTTSLTVAAVDCNGRPVVGTNINIGPSAELQHVDGGAPFVTNDFGQVSTTLIGKSAGNASIAVGIPNGPELCSTNLVVSP